MRTSGWTVAAVLVLGGLAGAQGKKGPPLSPDSFYALKSKTLEGKDIDLKEFAGKVSLVVNLASQ